MWAVDVNRRARELCQANADAAGLANVRVVAPEEVPDDLVVHAMWSNPPIRIGKPALHDLLRGWLGRLSSDGVALLVVQKHLGRRQPGSLARRDRVPDDTPRVATGLPPAGEPTWLTDLGSCRRPS